THRKKNTFESNISQAFLSYRQNYFLCSTSRISFPYRSSFRSPIPGVVLSCSREPGRDEHRCSNVESCNTTNAGTLSACDLVSLHCFSAANMRASISRSRIAAASLVFFFLSRRWRCSPSLCFSIGGRQTSHASHLFHATFSPKWLQMILWRHSFDSAKPRTSGSRSHANS